jgi:MFS transporter, DHA2 family, multidrug resistance protein
MNPANTVTDLPTSWRPRYNPWTVAMTVTLATFMEILDTSIANVSIPHIAGGLSASYDESTWILTSYLVSNAIVLPLSGWLATMMGRKRFYMCCVLLFTASSAMCGFAQSLETLVLFRIFQGAAGGGLGPSEQAILADTFPPEQFGMAFALYGMAVVLAPAIGPTLGGWITDNYDWRWIFFINLPVGILSLILSYRIVEDPPYLMKQMQLERRAGLNIDYIGLALIVAGTGALQVVLDKGQREDWFDSVFITTFMIIAVAGILTFILWEWNRERPIIDIRMFREPTFAIANFMLFMLGFILYGSTTILPQFMQEMLGYSAQQSGMALSPGGFAIMFTLPIVGYLSGRVDGRWLIALGLVATALSLYNMTSLNLQVDFRTMVLYRIYQSVGLAFLFIPINTMAYVGVPAEKNNQVSGMVNLARNIGGSVGISIVQTLLVRGTQARQDALSVHTTNYDLPFTRSVQGLAGLYFHSGPSQADAAHRSLAQMYGVMQKQASMLAYIDVFWFFAVGSIIIMPLILLMKKNEPGAGPMGAH